MEQPALQQPPKQDPTKRSLFSLIKKYFWYIVVFLIIAITGGVVMADHEAKSTANWKTFTSKDAGISFKHPATYKIIEDKGWRITVYTSEQNTENNYKILYSHKDPAVTDSAEEQFLANCQATRVSEVDAKSTRIKVYEDSTCGGQVVSNSVIVYSENGMNYDIGLFGTTDRNKLYQFLSTFTFTAATAQPTTQLSPTLFPSTSPALTPAIANPSRAQVSIAPEEVTMCTMDAKECSDGSFVGRTGPNCEFVCPDGKVSN